MICYWKLKRLKNFLANEGPESQGGLFERDRSQSMEHHRSAFLAYRPGHRDKFSPRSEVFSSGPIMENEWAYRKRFSLLF